MEGIEPWEPEETVGKLWHAWAAGFDAPPTAPEAAVSLEDEVGRLAVLFRGLGGDPAVEIRPIVKQSSDHRISLKRKLGTVAEEVEEARFDGEILRLPAQIASFPDPALNRGAYSWLAAVTACGPLPGPAPSDDPLQRDLHQLHAMHRAVTATLESCPGLAPLYARLTAAYLPRRPVTRLPRAEATLEAAIRQLLGTPDSPAAAFALATAVQNGDPILDELRAPRSYKPMRPVPLWPRYTRADRSPKRDAPAEAPPNSAPQETLEKRMKGKRHQADQAESRDSLILHKFEAILSFAEFLNINRRVDDDDPEAAKKAMDDLDELALTDVSKAPATRFKLDLDLAAEDVNREAVSGQFTYPEWDARQARYLPDHACVLASDADLAEAPAPMDAAAKRRVNRVRRQFESFRPKLLTLNGQPDGDTLDMEAVLRARADLKATGDARDAMWCRTTAQARDLSVSVLLDTSRSTESAVTGRPVIDIAREALTALAWGLDACGDTFAIHGFSSLRRDRVYVQCCKNFDTPMTTDVERRLASLRPGFYTRLGAAIRHVSADLQERDRSRRLLLVLTDGKPNDLDHYEGRHGIEDTRKAVLEARMKGQSVFGIAIDRKMQSWFPRLFGPGHFAVIDTPEKLTTALPQIYRQLVGAGG